MTSFFELPDRLNTQPFDRTLAHPSIFIAPSADLIGDIRLAEKSSIWYQAVLRADLNYISVGEGSNIQDGCVLHLANDYPCIIGKETNIGHHVNLHGCIIEDYCLIGIGAIVLNGAKVGKGSIIAAGAVVKEGEQVPPYSLMMGIPAKKVRTLSESSATDNQKLAQKYMGLAKKYIAN